MHNSLFNSLAFSFRLLFPSLLLCRSCFHSCPYSFRYHFSFLFHFVLFQFLRCSLVLVFLFSLHCFYSFYSCLLLLQSIFTMSTSPVVSVSSSDSESSLDASPFMISPRVRSRGRFEAPMFLEFRCVLLEPQPLNVDAPSFAGVDEGFPYDTEGFFQSLDPINPNMPSLTPPRSNPRSFAPLRSSPNASDDDIEAIEAYILGSSRRH